MNNNYCVIMAGGFSNQFWPLTRESKPKQFLKAPGTVSSFIKATYDRCIQIVPKENVIVVALEKHKDLVLEQIPELPTENLLLEPYARKTAPCIAYATYVILKRNKNAVVMVTPSDIIIQDNSAFKVTAAESMNYVTANNVLLTLGVVPNSPNPNFGYIQIEGGRSAATKHNAPIKVKTFTEKPNIEIAKAFYKSGEFFWNSGIFIWRADSIKTEMEKYIPQVTNLFTGWESALGSVAETKFIERAYTDCPKLYIDNGVMEKSDKVWLIPVNFGWSDVDNWTTMYDNYPQKDDNNNAVNTANKCLKEANNNLIISCNKDKLIAINGLEDYIVVDTNDVLLICPKNDVKYREFLASARFPKLEEFK